MSTKIEYSDDMREISGFGGSYEDTCRAMVVAGVEWANKKGDADPRWKEYTNIYGITTDRNEDAKELEEVMLKAADDDCTGAMMQACMNHVLFVIKGGWEAYKARMINLKLEEAEDEQKNF